MTSPLLVIKDESYQTRHQKKKEYQQTDVQITAAGAGEAAASGAAAPGLPGAPPSQGAGRFGPWAGLKEHQDALRVH